MGTADADDLRFSLRETAAKVCDATRHVTGLYPNPGTEQLCDQLVTAFAARAADLAALASLEDGSGGEFVVPTLLTLSDDEIEALLVDPDAYDEVHTLLLDVSATTRPRVATDLLKVAEAKGADYAMLKMLREFMPDGPVEGTPKLSTDKGGTGVKTTYG